MIDISKFDKADVLAALYNPSRPFGMGFCHFDPTSMTRGEAKKLLKKTTHFDYLKGRLMKIDLSAKNEFDPFGYNRDLGQGAAERAIEAI